MNGFKASFVRRVIPIPENNFTFKQRESGLKSLKKEGVSIATPSFLSDFRHF
jgi:hypothetical protein